HAGVLYLSTDESPANKTAIASVNGVLPRAWYSQDTEQSTNIFLEAGRRYYIEVLHKAGNGDDSFAVGWKMPAGILEQPMPVSRLRPFGMPGTNAPIFTSSPTNLTVVENSPATFRVGVSNLNAVTYQWQRLPAGGGATATNLAGANGGTYVIALPATNDNNAQFRCVISNSFGVRTSAV